jgi:hypothetical protein
MSVYEVSGLLVRWNLVGSTTTTRIRWENIPARSRLIGRLTLM